MASGSTAAARQAVRALLGLRCRGAGHVQSFSSRATAAAPRVPHLLNGPRLAPDLAPSVGSQAAVQETPFSKVLCRGQSSYASQPKHGLKIVGVFYQAHSLAHADPKFVGNVERGLDLKEWLHGLGHQYILTHDKDGENSELEKHLEDADVIITTPFHPAYITAERIKKAKKLKLLLTAGVGSDHVDIKAATNAGIVVAEVTGSNVVSVAEDELLRILLLVRNFLPAWQQITRGEWNVAAAVHRSHDVEGKTISTVGAGRIGFELLKRLKPFNANLIYYDRNAWDKEKEELTGAVRETDLDALLAKSDVLVLNVPLTVQTKGLFNKEKLSKLKKGAVVVNNARGALVDADAVVELIKSGHLAGYSGDVWSQQPPPSDHPWRLFKEYDRLALTPHISGSSLDGQARFAAGAKDILHRWFTGQEFLAKDYIVKPDGEVAPQYR